MTGKPSRCATTKARKSSVTNTAAGAAGGEFENDGAADIAPRPRHEDRLAGKVEILIDRHALPSLLGSALHGMLFLENLIRALLIFRLRSRHCQRALLGYHYPNFGGPACVLPARSCRRATRKRLFKRAGAGKIIAFFDIGHYLE